LFVIFLVSTLSDKSYVAIRHVGSGALAGVNDDALRVHEGIICLPLPLCFSELCFSRRLSNIANDSDQVTDRTDKNKKMPDTVGVIKSIHLVE